MPVHYPQADVLIAERFCRYGREDVAQGRVQRALEVASEVGLLLDRAASEMRAGAAVPRLQPSLPSYQALSRGPLKVRLFPGQTKPCIQHYINLNAGPSSSNYIAALQRDGLSGSWAMMNLLSSDGLRQFIETDRPICCYFTITPVQNHQLESNAPMLAAMDYVEKNHKGFYTYGVCEWENSFFRHWEKETDTTAIYGATPADLSRMDRKGNYDVLERTARRWKQSVRGRMMMANGYGMLSHLADIGLNGIGIETSETIPATQVKRAFARARPDNSKYRGSRKYRCGLERAFRVACPSRKYCLTGQIRQWAERPGIRPVT